MGEQLKVSLSNPLGVFLGSFTKFLTGIAIGEHWHPSKSGGIIFIVAGVKIDRPVVNQRGRIRGEFGLDDRVLRVATHAHGKCHRNAKSQCTEPVLPAHGFSRLISRAFKDHFILGPAGLASSCFRTQRDVEFTLLLD